MKHNRRLHFFLFTFLLFIGITGKAINLEGSLSVTNTCYGVHEGSITANVSNGTPPYTYLWSNGGTTQTISGLESSYYSLYVTDADGNAGKMAANLEETDPIRASRIFTNPTGYHAFDGTVTINDVIGGTPPYSYLWNDGPSWQNRTGLGGGEYQFMVTDNNGCSTDPISVYLTEPPRDDWSLTGATGTNPSTNFIGTTDNKDLVFKTNGSERMRMGSNGNVKINSLSGTSNRLLYVDQNGVVNSTSGPPSGGGGGGIACEGGIPQSWYESPGSDVDIFRCWGNVGIGTYSPTEKIDVVGNVKISSLAGSGNSIVTANSYGILGKTSGTGNQVLTASGWINPQGFSQWTSNINDIYFNTGNVGIGTSSPSEKLDVNGSIQVNNNAIYLRSSDHNHGLGFYDSYAGKSIGGPVIFGWAGGALGINHGGAENITLRWNEYGQVAINGDFYSYLGENYELAVHGQIIADEVVVHAEAWPDFVFKPTYKLKSLYELNEFICKNEHLPDVPSASSIEASGLGVGELVSKQMEKIEELTLYLIQLQQQIDDLKKENAEIKCKVGNK